MNKGKIKLNIKHRFHFLDNSLFEWKHTPGKLKHHIPSSCWQSCKAEGEMTDGPFLSGLEQMETNSHLSGWEVTITTASVRDAPIPHQSATNAIFTYINENFKTL